jgi:hypothetical protein
MIPHIAYGIDYKTFYASKSKLKQYFWCHCPFDQLYYYLCNFLLLVKIVELM